MNHTTEGNKTLEWLVPETALSFELMRSLRQKIPWLPKLQPLDTLQAEHLSLALSEHLTNLLQHNHHAITVSIGLQSEPKALVIQDNGQNITPLMQHAAASAPPDVLAEHGRGLWMLWQFFPLLRYQERDGVNQLMLPLHAVERRLVLVDDNPVQLALLELWLKSEYNTISFTEPLVALDYLIKHPVDLIICDIRMPVMDGFTLRQRLLADKRVQSVPFLFLSAVDDDELKDLAAELSIDDYMTKPMQETALKQTIKRILTRNQQVKQSFDAELGQTLTNSLWGDLPAQWQNWQLMLAYRVASRGGGDFVFQQQRENSLLIVLGDVMGHGVQAKFFSFALCGYLHGLCYAIAQQRSPAQLLSALSSALSEHTVLQQTLVTAIAIELFHDGKVLLSSAGHPAPWLSSADGQFKQLDVSGVLPGLMPNALYLQLEMHLQSQESLLLYTDGLSEQMEHRHGHGENDLAEIFAKFAATSSVFDLNELLNQYIEEQWPDDVTVLALRRM